MALTATATRHTRMDVIKKLGMKNCAVVSCSPHKPNIMLEVKEKSDLSTVLTPLVDDLLANGVSATKRIIYCKRYTEVSSIYHFFKRNLGNKFSMLSGRHDLPGF